MQNEVRMAENGGPQAEGWTCSSRTGRECAAMFQNLFDLVSHVRSVHMNLSINCAIDDCPRTFSSANVWYWHVRKCHYGSYQDRGNIRKRTSRSVDTFDAVGSGENKGGFRSGTYWISD